MRMNGTMRLGPPNKIVRNWIVKESRRKFWRQLKANLENFNSQSFVDLERNSDLKDGVLPKVGSTITVQYKIDSNGDFVDTEWTVLGYCCSIPERLKYYRGTTQEGNYEAVYVKTTYDGLLHTIQTGDSVYSDPGCTVKVGTIGVGAGLNGRFGNLCPYQIPSMLTTSDNRTFAFCSYNMVVSPKCAIIAKDNDKKDTFGEGMLFGSTTNCWSDSGIRQWLNSGGVLLDSFWRVPMTAGGVPDHEQERF